MDSTQHYQEGEESKGQKKRVSYWEDDTSTETLSELDDQDTSTASSQVSDSDGGPKVVQRSKRGRSSGPRSTSFVEDVKYRTEKAKRLMQGLLSSGEKWITMTGGKLYMHYHYQTKKSVISGKFHEDFFMEGEEPQQLTEASLTRILRSELSLFGERHGRSLMATPQVCSSPGPVNVASSSQQYKSPGFKKPQKRTPRRVCMVCKDEVVRIGNTVHECVKIQCSGGKCGWVHNLCLGFTEVNDHLFEHLKFWKCKKHVCAAMKEKFDQATEAGSVLLVDPAIWL